MNEADLSVYDNERLVTNFDKQARTQELQGSGAKVDDQDLVYRLRKRAEIRRQISTRKSVEEGKPDRIADLLEEAATEISNQRAVLEQMKENAQGYKERIAASSVEIERLNDFAKWQQDNR